MHIVFLILKIVGIAIRILLFLLAVVLFFPISYEADGDIEARNARVKINWLFRLIHFEAVYDSAFRMYLRIAFVRMPFTDPEWKAKHDQRKVEKKQKKKERENRKYQKALRKRDKKKEKITLDVPLESAVEQEKISQPENITGNTVRENMAADSIESGEQTTAEESSSAQDKMSKILSGVKKGISVLKLVREDDIPEIVWPPLQILLLRIAPEQMAGEITFGMEDPSQTGRIVGGLAMIPFLYQMQLTVIPDFEADRNYIIGQARIKGKIILFFVLVFVIRLIKEKKFRIFIKQIFGKEKKNT